MVRAIVQRQWRRCAVFEAKGAFWSQWVLATSNESRFLDIPEVSARITEQAASIDPRLHWTDDHSSLLRVLSFG